MSHTLTSDRQRALIFGMEKGNTVMLITSLPRPEVVR